MKGDSKMTTVQRRRAKKLQNVTYLYSRGCRVWLGLLLASALQLIILACVIFFGREDDQLFIMSPCMSMFSILPFFGCIAATGIDRGVNEKGFQEIYHSSSTPSMFLCNMPFEARDMLNLKITVWEKAAAVNVLMVALGHIAALTAEAQGFSIYHGVSGLYTLLALIAEILLMIPYTFKNNYMTFVVGFIIGIGFAALCGLMDEIDGMSAGTLASLKIFSGVSGIIIYGAATFLIAFAGEMYINHKKNVSWRLFK